MKKNIIVLVLVTLSLTAPAMAELLGGSKPIISDAPRSKITPTSIVSPSMALCADPAVTLQVLDKSIQNGQAVFKVSGTLCNRGVGIYNSPANPLQFFFHYQTGWVNSGMSGPQQDFKQQPEVATLKPNECRNFGPFTFTVPGVTAWGSANNLKSHKLQINSYVKEGTGVDFYNNRMKNCQTKNDDMLSGLFYILQN
jgi:hypothetical protein